MQFIKRHRKIIFLVAIIVTAGIVFAVFLTELCRLPFKKVLYRRRPEPPSHNADAIDEILEPYGLTTQPYRVGMWKKKRPSLASQYLCRRKSPE